jgi:hypothetical protein
MTRFDATTEDARRELFADAIRAHDERDSAFLTIEVAGAVSAADEDSEATVVPWVQFADGVLNLDCTDAELDRLKSLLDPFSAFTIDALDSPEEADGTNVRVVARTDPERTAEFIDSVFREVYEYPADYWAWVAAV